MEEPLRKSNRDQRIYFGLLQRVGSYGDYQKNILAIFSLVSALGAATFFINPFIFFQDPYVCEDGRQNCQQYVCSLEQSQRLAYQSEMSIKTLGNHFGDLRCERIGEMVAMQSALLWGAFLGIFIALLFTELLGRKATVIYSIAMTILGIFLTIVLPSTGLACIGLFLWGAGAQISYTMVFPMITQLVDESHRSKYYVYLLIFFGVGSMVNSFFFYVIKSWKEVLFLCYIVPNLIAMMLFQHYVEDTPIELISKQTPENAFKAFLRIAGHNGIHNHKLSIEQIGQLQQQYRKNQQSKHNYHFWFLDLFKYPSVRQDVIKLSLFFFFVMFELYAPALLLDQLHMNIYIECIINGFSQLVTVPVLLVIVTTLPRRKGSIIMMSGCAFFSAVVTFLAPQNCLDCSSAVITLIFFFCFRFFANISSNFFCNSLQQTFPAQVRTLGIYFVVAFGRSSSLFIPFLFKLRDHYNISLMLIFTVVSFLGIIGACSIRETLGIPPVELIKELELQQRNYQFHVLEK